jgi:Zn-dependent protease with chaperone function
VQRLIRGMAGVLASVTCAICGTALAKAQVVENAETVYLARDFVFVESPAVEGYLRTICQRMLDARGMKLEVPNILVQSSDAFSAFVDGRGNLVVSTGALRAVESEDELAALLGHELSHLILKHPQDKDVMTSLPLGMETMSSVGDAAAELKSQVGVLWSDFISPSWNRKQEREADESGFELMRAAGYDPTSFGQLFGKLQAAEVKRSERMQVLKRTLLARLRDSAAHNTNIASNVKTAVADDASERLVNGLSSFNRSYESPDERQTALATYAREHRQKQRVPSPQISFAESLQRGEGGAVLTLDVAAIGTLDALAARNADAAKKAAQEFGDGSATPPSAHLHLAIGSYNQLYGSQDVGERSSQAWMASRRPPAQAFAWVASSKAKRKDYAGAIETLEAGRQRVGASAPFLPTLVATARAAGNMPLAREYAKECQSESRTVGGTLQSLTSESTAPKGLYAECLRQLGEKPQQDVVTEAVTHKAKDLGRKLFKLN